MAAAVAVAKEALPFGGMMQQCLSLLTDAWLR